MCGVSVVVVAAGVAGKPSFAHSFALLEYFQDSPEGGECGDAEGGAPEHVGDEYGGGKRHDAEQEEDPPAPCAEVVFAFDYDRMEQSNYKKCAKAYGEAEHVAGLQELCHGRYFAF